jgi:hypothetical protein
MIENIKFAVDILRKEGLKSLIFDVLMVMSVIAYEKNNEKMGEKYWRMAHKVCGTWDY